MLDGNGCSLEEDNSPLAVAHRGPVKRTLIESVGLTIGCCGVSARKLFTACWRLGDTSEARVAWVADALGNSDACILQDGHLNTQWKCT